MYESFYSFRNKPFSLLPDPEFLYLSKKHQMALTLLEYGLWNQASFSVITGEIGTGKTTMIRHLLNKMDKSLVVGLISNTHPSFGELLEWILLAYDLEHKGKDNVEMYKTFVDFLIREYAANRRTVLIIDEAQNMSHEALEELRMLSNINVEKDQVLQVILVGQAELRDHLRDPRLEQFAQRIAVDYHLEPLTNDETADYIRHRLTVAGGDPALFDDAACHVIYEHTGGVPRLINLLCDTALVYGYAEQARHITAELACDVVQERLKGSVLPLRKPHKEAGGTPTEGKQTPGGSSKKSTKSLQGKKKIQILIASDSEAQRSFLKMILERNGLSVIAAVGLDEQSFTGIRPNNIDVVLVDLHEISGLTPDYLNHLVENIQQCCKAPVLFNDSSMEHFAGGTDLGRKLSIKLGAIAGRA